MRQEKHIKIGPGMPAGPFFCFTHHVEVGKCPAVKHTVINRRGKYVK